MWKRGGLFGGFVRQYVPRVARSGYAVRGFPLTTALEGRGQDSVTTAQKIRLVVLFLCGIYSAPEATHGDLHSACTCSVQDMLCCSTTYLQVTPFLMNCSPSAARNCHLHAVHVPALQGAGCFLCSCVCMCEGARAYMCVCVFDCVLLLPGCM